MTPEEIIAQAQLELETEDFVKEAGIADLLKQDVGTFIRRVPGTLKFKVGNLLGDARGTYRGILAAEGGLRPGVAGKAFAKAHVDQNMLDAGLGHALKDVSKENAQTVENVFKQTHANKYQAVADANATLEGATSHAPVPMKTYPTAPQAHGQAMPPVKNFGERVKGWIQDHPLHAAGAIGGTALGVGLLAGRLRKREDKTNVG